MAVLACGAAGLFIVGRIHADFMDCSVKEIHESANTPLGWSIALAASLVPVVVAASHRNRRLTAAALVVAAVELVVWWWAFTAGDC